MPFQEDTNTTYFKQTTDSLKGVFKDAAKND